MIAYAGARAFASIYVEAKALAILAPLVVLATLFALFYPGAWARGLGREEGDPSDGRKGAPGSRVRKGRPVPTGRGRVARWLARGWPSASW